ncbi:UNVERIFIED_CONTAM: DNA-binding protein BIN4 [Sesamum indicum]
MDVFTMLKLPLLFVCTEPPTLSAIELSSGSESPLDGSPAISDDEDDINLSKLFKKEAKQDSDINDKDYMTEAVVNKPVKGKSPKKNGKGKSPKKNDKVKPTPERKRQSKDESEREENDVKEDSSRKHPGLQGSSSRLPLLLSEKVQRSKALVECEGDSIDLSGDVGSVGRIVSFGQSEAKIEAIMNDYIQLKPQSNVFEAETMVEGTLDGFPFDSEDENEKSIAQADQHEAAEEQPDGKSKRKPDKTLEL